MTDRNRDLDDEIRSHLQMAGEDQGHEAAHREFGNVTLIKEITREMWGYTAFDRLVQDVRFALRTMRRSPGFTSAAVLSLALGIGANTALFSVIDACVLRKLPVPDPDHVVMFGERFGVSPRVGPHTWYQLFEIYRRNLSSVFTDLSAVALTDRSSVIVPGGADPGLVRVGLVSGNYFSMMKVAAYAGRTLTPDDDRKPGAHPVATVSSAFAARQFGLPVSAAVGQRFSLNGVTYDVIGVAARGFVGDWVGRPVDIWIPAMMESQVMIEMPGLLTRKNPWIRVVGRLAPGVTREQALAFARVVYEREKLSRLGPNPDPEEVAFFKSGRLEMLSDARGYSPERDSYGQMLAIVIGVVGLVLVLACANVANLLPARSAARHREIAVRLAIGASRTRLVKQLLTESVLLSILGGGLGLLCTLWITGALSRNISLGPAQLDSRAPSPWLSVDLHLDPLVFAVTAGLCIFTGILFGLAPALRGSKIALAPSLTSKGTVDAGSGGRLGKALVIAQVAISLVLVSGAGLFVRTLRNLKTRDLGFERHHLLMIWTSPGQTGRQGPKLVDFWKIVQERIESLPGVVSAAASNQGLLNGWGVSDSSGSLDIQGQTRRYSSLPSGWRTFVTPRFFETTGMELISGRDFTEHDHEKSHRAVIINESTAKAYFPNQNPIGQSIAESSGGDPYAEIVGVVKDFAAGTPRMTAFSLTYLPYRQFGHAMDRMCIFVRTSDNPTSVVQIVRQQLRDLDPNLPVFKIDTVDEQLDDVLLQERFIAGLSGAFGALAVALACIGLYGVISYSTARRTNEIGIRLALGAERRTVLAMVLGNSIVLAIAGVAIGVPATLGMTRLIAAKLFGVTSSDPWTIAGASALMIGVAALAGLLPARRAANLDPMAALRCE
ncbi:MAG TPA: ABC transporter permease [Bryobacteraceae bacterium]|jgi:predicted permease|nr:ABC transporter permease [Bryobacteraceae bacterium]